MSDYRNDLETEQTALTAAKAAALNELYLKAVPDIPTKSSADWDTLDQPGFHDRLLMGTSPNGPSADYYYCQVFTYNNSNILQVAYPYRATVEKPHIRSRFQGAWTPWKRLPYYDEVATAAQGALAESAVQAEIDPTVPTHVKAITTSDINDWNTALQPQDVIFRQGNGALQISNLDAQQYFNNGIAGAIKIKLPQLISGKQTMIKFDVSVFDYTSHKSFDVTVSDYFYAPNGSWLGASSVVLLGDSPSANYTIRFGSENNHPIVYIGELTKNWSNHHVKINNFSAGYSAPQLSDFSGQWEITHEATAFSGVNSTLVDNFPYSDFNKQINQPTTLGGYGITDAYQNWKLWTNGVQRTSINSLGKVDLVAGTGLTNAYGAGGVVTHSFDTAWGDGRYLQSFTETDPAFSAYKPSIVGYKTASTINSLDDVTENGVYTLAYDGSIANFPTNEHGILVVEGDLYAVQTQTFTTESNRRFYRTRFLGTPYPAWEPVTRQSWVTGVLSDYALVSQLFSGDYNDLGNLPSLYQNWKLWTDGVQRTSINSLQKLDLVAGNNMSIGYGAGGVVTFDVTGLHSHANKSILDAIDQSDIDYWDNKIGGTGGVINTGFIELEDQYSGWLREISQAVDQMYVFQTINLQPTYSPIIRHGFWANTQGTFDKSKNYWFFSRSAGESPLMTIDLLGRLGVGLTNAQTDYEPATESLDAVGTARLRDVPNGTGDFPRIDPTGVVKKRTLKETKKDLGIAKGWLSSSQTGISFDAGKRVFSSYTGTEPLPVTLPDATAFDQEEFEVTIKSSVTLNFIDENETAVNVIDLHNGETITSHTGSLRLTPIEGNWHKIGP